MPWRALRNRRSSNYLTPIGNGIPNCAFLLSDGTAAKFKGRLGSDGRALIAFADCQSWPLKNVSGFEPFCGVHEILTVNMVPPGKLPQGVPLESASTTASRHDLTRRTLWPGMHHTFYLRFDVGRIPEIVKQILEFTHGAAFLRKWFSASSTGSGFAGRFDNTTVDMTWLMSFKDVSDAIEHHLSHRKYLTEQGKKGYWRDDCGKRSVIRQV